MIKKYIACLMVCFLILSGIKTGVSQNKIKWWDPAKTSFPVVEGQSSHSDLALPYDRLPVRLKKEVRKPVWDLSEDAAGLIIRFRSDASAITVRYTVSKTAYHPHMPATGTSGIDLYALDRSGNWQWSAGKYQFSDTITYRFTHLRHEGLLDYFLYLPLYNQVKWLEIGVEEPAVLKPVPVLSHSSIVVYGTSIAQGLVASRPGMAWTALLGRELRLPVINLAFSGNGQLESPIIQLMTEVDAKIYILDCMPNMWYDFISPDTVRKRLINAVRLLRKAHPAVPILLTEDADINIMPLDTSRYLPYQRVNDITREVFQELKAEGIKSIYLLTAKEIGLRTESTTDGTHPNDYGMKQYADAYAGKIKEIFDEQ